MTVTCGIKGTGIEPRRLMGDIRVGSSRVAIAIGPKNVTWSIKSHTHLNNAYFLSLSVESLDRKSVV